ncbi:DUF1802 family protein [Coleofasciculus sp. FACHB-1120]|uniref:DUF1802 family protein n=1 Tax=Coleofasciculus sp. FACHB-1120 TaxID=2692783 RepID=UPI00168872E5|nr:DUF1802 family protein [Coleofasciculus sp. FACHB-1120]MBD2740067.1 DUF1802 family protein [Coleofasciculus sp. FACHB-1120]
MNTALRLPAPDVEALIQGRMIAAMSQIFLNPRRQFALYSSDASINLLPTEHYYRSDFLPIAQSALAQLNSETVLIKAWAKCETCQILNDAESLAALSRLTVWTSEALQEILSQRGHIFLVYLRVYLLPQPLEVPVNTKGNFVSLPNLLTITESSPVLSDRVFSQRRQQLELRQPPLHPELEELQNAIAQLSADNPAAEELDRDIKIFLGWGSGKPAKRLDSDESWIEKIAQIGNSSDGHTFEKLVRKGFLKLGFSGSGLDPNSMGGAGGMDFYCDAPYPMVGECKATKTEKVPDGTPAQLLKIGMNHLGKSQYERSIKLIVAAGELNFYANRTATENQMNVIRPETLQRLVEMQAQHKNSINLLELKQCLQQAPFGLADDKVNRYIDKINQDIKLRSHLIQLLKKHLETTGEETVAIDALHVAYLYSSPPQPLKREEMHDILIELSSPLTGYLGRKKGGDGSDRFYFLRDLPAA